MILEKLSLKRESEGLEKSKNIKKHNIIMNDFKNIKVAVAGTGYVGLSIVTLLS